MVPPFPLRFLVLPLIFASSGVQLPGAEKSSPPNILHIFVDDLKPLLGTYGAPLIQSPNIDRLAAEGLRFDRAFAHVSICGPSRTALMTGLRSSTTRCLTNKDHFRDSVPDAVTLPQALRAAGYSAYSVGKTFDQRLTDPVSWNGEFMTGLKQDLYVTEEFNQLYRDNTERYRNASPEARRYLWRVGPPVEKAGAISDHFDGQVAEKAIDLLSEIPQPFYLAVGFTKPHLPFSAPPAFWDLYDPEAFPLPSPRRRPDDVPLIGYHEGFELRDYHGVPLRGLVPDAMARELIHGYHASVSFVDALVGQLLEALDRLGLRENTIVVLWGDHGFHLGEKEIWCKFTAFQNDTRTPLIVVDPRIEARGGTDGIVEAIDIYPTLCELAGVEAPGNLDGTSFAALLRNPEASGKPAALTSVGRGRGWKEFVGTSVYSDGFNYIEWRHRESGRLRTSELYDLSEDPAETKNLADDPEHQETVRRLSRILEKEYPRDHAME